jgi:hypothetical protein
MQGQAICEYGGPRLPLLMLEGQYVLKVPGTRLGVDGNCEASLFDDLVREPAIFSNHSARPNTIIEHWPRMGPGMGAGMGAGLHAGPGATEGERHRLEQARLTLTLTLTLTLILTLTLTLTSRAGGPTTYCLLLLPTTHDLLLTTHCLPRTTLSSRRVAHCGSWPLRRSPRVRRSVSITSVESEALTSAHYSLLTAHYSLLTAHCSLLATHYLGTYWHGAPPAETVWRAARVEPPESVEHGGEGGGALPPARNSGDGKQPGQRALGGGKQPPERAIDVLSAIQHATQRAYSTRRADASGTAAGSKSRAGAPFQRGDLGAQLELAIQATTSRPKPFEWGSSSGSGGGSGGGSGSGSSGDERLLLVAASLRGQAGVNQSGHIT